ncbi:hypothetical protein XFF6992_230126 [Xanthomonas citri pv. fuscans]|nr:hypothetical protein XFF6992_230126 [Xanthomonas citri pv. fuscans]SOO32401.1 hypothetical protein XFF6994_1890017 [Xanthomonas citri pv. fuscans]
MPPLSRSSERLLFIASMLLMTATRFHHVSDWLHLPDASMAVFFLGGLALRRHGYFVALLGVSVAIDWAAVRLAGVSDFCITAPTRHCRWPTACSGTPGARLTHVCGQALRR